MNVFEYLGLPASHRPSGKVVQLVKNFEEVPEKKIKYPLTAQVKKDGVYGLLVVTQNQAKVFGRTGKALSNCDGFIDPCTLEDGVYIGEVCLPGKSLEALSGIVNPNRTKALEPELSEYWFTQREFWFHDYLSIPEFVAGKSSRPYADRLRDTILSGLPTVRTCTVNSPASAESFAQLCIESGEEGAVFKQEAGWVAGHKGWHAMKRVRSIEYDLLCVGVEEGTGKYAGKVANLIFQWRDGDTLKAMLGKGWTHLDAEKMWEDREQEWDSGLELPFNRIGCKGMNNPIGHIFTVYGLQDSSKGKVRLPKVGEIRHDKDTPDF